MMALVKQKELEPLDERHLAETRVDADSCQFVTLQPVDSFDKLRAQRGQAR